MDTQDANNKPIGDMPEAPKQDSAEQPKPLGDVTFGGNTSNKKPMMIIGGIVAALVLVGLGVWWWLMQPGASNNNTGDKSGKTELVYAVHWLEDPQISGIKDKDGKLVSKGLQQYLDEYTSLHPDITFKLRQTHVSKYNDDLKVAADSGSAPDIYQIYSTWGPSYVRDGLFAAPPADVKEDIEKNYVSTVGATIDGKIWGYPTEINNYALLYNKDLFKAAGIANAPTTWTDVVNDAKKLTKRDAAGAITQYGIAFTRDTDWSVVDPYLSLLYSNGGDFLSSDYKKSVVNSPAGVAALNGMVQLFTNKSVLHPFRT